MRPAPDALALTGALTALLGYVVPWFRQQDGYMWSYSGWAFASLSDGGGWTLLTFGWLGLALVASLWAGRHSAAALTTLVGGIAALFFSLVVVAACFSNVPDRNYLNYLSQLPFGPGLPLLAGGLALLVAGAVRSIVRTALREQGR
jgi:hypothetical protein